MKHTLMIFFWLFLCHLGHSQDTKKIPDVLHQEASYRDDVVVHLDTLQSKRKFFRYRWNMLKPKGFHYPGVMASTKFQGKTIVWFPWMETDSRRTVIMNQGFIIKLSDPVSSLQVRVYSAKMKLMKFHEFCFETENQFFCLNFHWHLASKVWSYDAILYWDQSSSILTILLDWTKNAVCYANGFFILCFYLWDGSIYWQQLNFIFAITMNLQNDPLMWMWQEQINSQANTPAPALTFDQEMESLVEQRIAAYMKKNYPDLEQWVTIYDFMWSSEMKLYRIAIILLTFGFMLNFQFGVISIALMLVLYWLSWLVFNLIKRRKSSLILYWISGKTTWLGRFLFITVSGLVIYASYIVASWYLGAYEAIQWFFNMIWANIQTLQNITTQTSAIKDGISNAASSLGEGFRSLFK